MTEDEAKRRFFTLALLRFVGVALVMLGVAVVAKHLIEPAEVTGYVLIVAGALAVVVLPPLLVRRWKR